MNLNETFSLIYRNQHWGTKESVGSNSGEGSDPDIAMPYVNYIKQVIEKLEIASVVDLGHGDWEMWRDYQFENVQYTGLDLVDFLSQDLSQKFGNHNRKFITINSNDVYPDGDLFICKDVLQHLSNRDIVDIWAKIEKFDHIILCNDINFKVSILRRFRHFIQIKKRLRAIKSMSWPFYFSKILKNNSAIESGGYRALDLENADFLKFNKHRLIYKFDFQADQPKGTVKRVLHLQKISL